MIQIGMRNSEIVSGRLGLLAGCALVLSGCAVSVPLTINSATDESAARPAQIAIAMPDDSDETLKARFASALASAFDGQGITAGQDGALIADYSVSIASAEMGLRGADPSSDPGSDGWIATPREPRRFDECDAMMMRGTLLLLDRADSSIAYRGQGTAIECEFDDAAVRDMADQLVADFIAQQ